jgi:prophage regulatory protein
MRSSTFREVLGVAENILQGLTMTEPSTDRYTIIRRSKVQAETGYSRSTIYLRIAQGLLVKPIRLGSRAVGFPAGEIAALNQARIAGKSDAELRALVQKLMRARGEVPR